MADGTVRGAFHLEGEQPIQTLTTIRTRARESKTALRELGDQMDTLATKTATSWAAMSRTVDTHADKIEGRVERLDLKLRDLGGVTATPTVELNGFDRTNAQITELERRLDSLNRQRVTPRVAIGGGFGNMAGGAGGDVARAATPAGGSSGANRSPLLSTLGGIPGALPWWAALAPVAPALLGGATSLVGSAASAALGAGTVGLGGAAMLGVGGGLSALAFKPALAGLQSVTKAQLAYNKAVGEFGKTSAQAARAQVALNYAIVANPAAAGAARQDALLHQEWTAAIAPAKAQAYRGISGVLYNARRAAPQIGRDATIATGATSNAAISYSGFLTQQPQLSAVGTLTRAFATELPTAERTLENMTSTVEHLAVAAIPFFHEANVWVEHWSSGLSKSSSNTAAVQGKMQGYVNSAKDWARLTGAAYRTIRDIFSAATPAGNSMVAQLTTTLDSWDSWINKNPAKVQTFFTNAGREVSSIADTLSRAVKDIWQVLQAAAPIVDRIVQALGLVSGLGPGGIGIGGAVAYGAYGGLRGATGNRLPSAGTLTGAFVTGGAGPGLMRGTAGGGGVAAGGLVGGGAYSSTLARSANTSYLMPRSMNRFYPTLGSPVPAGALGSELPLLAAIGGTGYAGTMLAGGAASPINFAQRTAALRASSGLPLAEARYAGPVSELGEQAGLLSRLGGVGGAVLSGAAKFALPVLAVTSILQGIQRPGGFGAKAQGTADAALHMGSFGIFPSNTVEQLLGSVNAGGTITPFEQRRLQSLSGQAGSVRTVAQARAVQRQVPSRFGGTAQGPGLGAEMDPAAAKKLDAFFRQISQTAAANAGIGASDTWENAFSTALGRGEKPAKAIKTMLTGMTGEMRSLGPQGSKAFAASSAVWITQLEQDNPKLRKPLESLMESIIGDANRQHKTLLGIAKDTRDQIFYFNGQILTGTQSVWPKISDAMLNPAQVAQEKLFGIFGQIQSEAVTALTQMGFSRQQAKTIVTQTARGGKFASNQASIVNAQAIGSSVSQGGANSPHARGGVIGGTGLLDTVHLPGGAGTAAPGEAWIANRHTMMDLSAATLEKYGKTAWEIIRDEPRAHSAPHSRGGGVGAAISSAFGGGPVVLDPGVNMSVGQEPQILSDLRRLAVELRRTVYVISGYRSPAHSVAVGGFPNDPHTRGQAADIGIGSASRASMFGISEAQLRAVGLYRPFYPPSAAEVNHVQLLNAGGGARGTIPVAAAHALSLRAPGSGLGGVPGAMADQASRMYAAGLTQRLNAHVGGGGGISAAGFTGGGNSQANQTLGRRMMLAAGWNASQWPALQALWTQESGWNASAVNSSSGAYGIPQALGHGHPFNLGDAPSQIAWGLNYIRGRYGSPDAAEAHERSAGWYTRGGKASWGGWHGNGTDFTTKGPTVIGVGEVPGRRERVTVTPAHSPTSGGGARIQVIMQNVTLNGGSQEDLQRVAEDVAGKILDALDNAGVGGSDAALAGAGS